MTQQRGLGRLRHVSPGGSRRRRRVGLAVSTAVGFGALLSVTSGVGVGPAGALDCPKPAPTVALNAAQSVFAGTVLVSTPTPEGFLATVAVDRSYKGESPGAQAQVRTSSSACELGQLTVGQSYLVMATAEGLQWSAAGDSGTQPLSPWLQAKAAAVLGAGVEVTGDDVRFVSLDLAEPTPFLRAAAPGLAVALVGALGLLAVRRRA